MMKFVKTLFGLIMAVLVLLALSYNLPTHDVVHIVGTDIKRMDIKEGAWGWDRPDAGTEHNDIRDVRFINAIKYGGKPMVYRNEDTDFGWPPYLKFDSGDLNAQAQELAKNPDQWVVVGNYGWRMQIFSIYPNSYSLKPVDSPDVVIIPWFNIIFLAVMLFLFFWIRRWIRLFFSGGKKSKKAEKTKDGAD